MEALAFLFFVFGHHPKPVNHKVAAIKSVFVEGSGSAYAEVLKKLDSSSCFAVADSSKNADAVLKVTGESVAGGINSLLSLYDDPKTMEVTGVLIRKGQETPVWVDTKKGNGLLVAGSGVASGYLVKSLWEAAGCSSKGERQ